MNQRDELEKQYNLLDEKIVRLRTARIIETDAATLFKLDKQIEAAEAERKQIELQIDNLDSAACIQDLHRALLKLGYREQIVFFKKFIKTLSIGAFLIHGSPDYGQRWLLNRLVTQYVHYGTAGKVVRVELDRIARRRDISALWRELAGWVGLGRQHSTPEIAERVYQWWQTQNVILIFHDVDCMPESYIQELLCDFWLPLASKARNVISQTPHFQLLMFLVDYEGCVGTKDTLFVEQLEPTWEPKIPIKLPKINAFCDRVLTDWLETIEIEFDKLPILAAIDQMQNDPVQVILNNSDNGIPELAMSEICGMCGCNWYEEKERWLKL